MLHGLSGAAIQEKGGGLKCLMRGSSVIFIMTVI